MNNIIYTDCDGVLVNWISEFYRWIYSIKNISIVKSPTNYPIEESLDLSKEIVTSLVIEFNSSEYIKYCPPLVDAIKYVKKLHEEHGYVFIVITAMLTTNGLENRKRNLKSLFGSAIKDVLVTMSSGKKQPLLHNYWNIEEMLSGGTTKPNNIFWIEDSVKNCKIGHDLGFYTILMSNEYNKIKNIPELLNFDSRVSTWKEIYNIIT